MSKSKENMLLKSRCVSKNNWIGNFCLVSMRNRRTTYYNFIFHITYSISTVTSYNVILKYWNLQTQIPLGI